MFNKNKENKENVRKDEPKAKIIARIMPDDSVKMAIEGTGGENPARKNDYACH